MSGRTTSDHTRNVIFSQASAAGPMQLDWLDGRTNGRSGPAPARASHSPLQAGDLAFPTTATFGLTCPTSSRSAVLQASLEKQSAAAPQWLRLVRGDLEALGYAVGAIPIEAASAGARHRRDRYWIVADAEWNEQPRQEPRRGEAGRVGRVIEPFPWNEPWQCALSRLRALGHGLPRSVGATDAARNAIVPQVAAEVIAAFMDVYGVPAMQEAA